MGALFLKKRRVMLLPATQLLKIPRTELGDAEIEYALWTLLRAMPARHPERRLLLNARRRLARRRRARTRR